jgi:hypothetical protein
MPCYLNYGVFRLSYRDERRGDRLFKLPPSRLYLMLSTCSMSLDNLCHRTPECLEPLLASVWASKGSPCFLGILAQWIQLPENRILPAW